MRGGGYAQFKLARLQGRATLGCMAYELTESEALHWLLQRHRRSDGLNASSRILLALDFEADFSLPSKDSWANRSRSDIDFCFSYQERIMRGLATPQQAGQSNVHVLATLA